MQNLIAAKLLRFIVNKVDGFIRHYDCTKYLVLFGPEKYDVVFVRIKYSVLVKSSITCVDCHSYFDSDDDLTVKSITMLRFYKINVAKKESYCEKKNNETLGCGY